MRQGLPVSVRVHRVRALGLSWRNIPGLGTLSYRARGALRKAGNAILTEAKQNGEPFDLVYFSTTQLGVNALAPYWKSRFDVPFVIDYQDPWVNDFYDQNRHIRPPGGRLKYAVVNRIARFAEPRVLRQCHGITAVSAAYPRQLRERYEFLANDFPCLVAPFPCDSRDIDRVAKDDSITQSLFNKNDGLQHWVYVGRGGEDLHTALKGLFAALQNNRKSDEQTVGNLRLHFIGTSYAAAGRGQRSIKPLAASYGLEDITTEVTDRVPYSVSLRCLLDADALIVPGSNDPGYTASKIYPYLLANKPLLCVFNEASSVVQIINQVGGATLATFSEQSESSDLAREISTKWLHGEAPPSIPVDREALKPYTAKAQAIELAAFFRTVLKRR